MKISPNNRLAELEQEHRDFLEAMHDLSLKENYEDQEVRYSLIAKGFEYISNHIIREEQTMIHFRYPDIEPHIEAHDKLQKTFLIIMKEVLTGSFPHENLMRLLDETFVTHIETIDKQFFDWLSIQEEF